jgi:short-subunit dehydrogenase
MNMNIENRTVVLTGASGGIGRAIAQSLDACGARLVLVGRKAEKLDALQKTLTGKKHLPVAVDLNTRDGRRDLLQACNGLDEGGISLLINCLGINELRLFAEQTEVSIEQQIQTNLLCPILVCHDLLPLLQQRPEALIVNIGSTFGSIGHPGFSSYCAAKFGLRGFTEALRRELADTAVEVSYIAPRATRTDLNSDSINAMNEALGTSTDDPALVAKEVLNTIRSRGSADRYLGWPEKIFVRINALLPGLVDSALRKQLPLIRRFAQDSVN